jgi:hypothetical protein
VLVLNSGELAAPALHRDWAGAAPILAELAKQRSRAPPHWAARSRCLKRRLTRLTGPGLAGRASAAFQDTWSGRRRLSPLPSFSRDQPPDWSDRDWGTRVHDY